ncbi:PucR family transcriptional regulator [Alloiococcus sp. CFN-8]|uniref:PucR family transcriptional regulator n=1 Tax=Alloiococcus sp. CFN-8 TaxID=3416081 RepID=UPI003CF1E477
MSSLQETTPHTSIEENIIAEEHLEDANFISLSKEYLNLLSLVYSNITLDELEEYGSKFLGNPLIITDDSYKLLAFTRDYDIQDPIWKVIIQNSYCPIDYVDKTDVDSFWDKLEKSELPLFVPDEAFESCATRVVAKLKTDNETQGYIALLQIKKKITLIDLYKLQILAKVISMVISRRDIISIANGQLKDEFISDLLKGNMVSNDMANHRSQALKIPISPLYCAAFIKSELHEDNIRATADSLKTYFSSKFSTAAYTITNEGIYFVLGYHNEKNWYFFNNPSFEKELIRRKLKAMISLSVNEITRIHMCYKEIEKIRSLMKSFHSYPSPVILYNKIAPYSIIADYQNNNGRTLTLSRSYVKLKEIDTNQKTQYIFTLKNFFLSNQNSTEASERMFIHRNTINYRLNRIREIIDDDFDDPIIRLHLQLSIMIDEVR